MQGGEGPHSFHGFLVGMLLWVSAPLHLGNLTILSCCGVQQGDPLGPLGFALALHIENVNRTVPGLLINTWYLDDGTLCGSATDLCAALEIIGAEGHLRGLSLNRGKSLLYAPADSSLSNNAFPPDIPVTNGGFKLLGSPVGPASHCESTVGTTKFYWCSTVYQYQLLPSSFYFSPPKNILNQR